MLKSSDIESQWRARWTGQTVACIASGPSLTPADCEFVRSAKIPTIVTNTTFRLCPWADVLFGFDCRWWREYHDEVSKVFAGEKLTCSPMGPKLGVTTLHQQSWFQGFHNSGAAAISLAIVGGAKRIILLGYDCQKTGGRSHWHEPYEKPLGDALSMPRWPFHFKQVERLAKTASCHVINCTRATALTCFERGSLEEALPVNRRST